MVFLFIFISCIYFCLDFTNLNDSNLDTTSPIKASAESSDQISVDNEKLFSDDANTEPEKLEEPKDLGRWDDTLKEHEKQQQAEKQEENNEILPNGNSLIVHR
jgi:hypothetical protein